MKTFTQEQLNEILENHRLWLNNEGGSRADLRGAILNDANLNGASGNMDQLKSILIETYPITYTSEILQIGCQKHKIEDWWNFDDEKIISMDGKTTLKFWRNYKELIKMTIELSPANSTKQD